MADIKISELTAVSSLNNGDLVEVSQVNELAPSGYTSLKATMTDLGEKVNTDIEYTTDLADFTDKTTLGAIKETAKGKNIADEYDDTQTYNKGDVVIYKNTLYICQDDNVTGNWDSTKWLATTVDDLIPKTAGNLPLGNDFSDPTSTAGAIGAYSTIDFLDNAEYTWSQIIHAEGTTQFQIIRKGQIGIINVRFATSGAIDSGTLNIPNSPPTAYTEVRGAITSKDGKTGFIQYSGNTFVIRCQTSSNVFAGSLVFPIG